MAPIITNGMAELDKAMVHPDHAIATNLSKSHVVVIHSRAAHKNQQFLWVYSP